MLENTSNKYYTTIIIPKKNFFVKSKNEQILVKVSTLEKLKKMSAERFEENIYVEVPIQMNCPRCGKEMWTKVKTRPLEKGDKGCWSRFFCWVRNIFFGSKS